VSAYPRVVLTGVQVTWGEPGCGIHVKAGARVDVNPGSALEAAYGGPPNLHTLAPAELQGGQSIMDRSALAN
jgi:hypothetical protein